VRYGVDSEELVFLDLPPLIKVARSSETPAHSY